jgi:hypothetical protein
LLLSLLLLLLLVHCFLLLFVKSLAFLSTYVATAWFACCMTDVLRGWTFTKRFLGEHFSFLQLASTVWVAGLTTFIESPSRRNVCIMFLFFFLVLLPYFLF